MVNNTNNNNVPAIIPQRLKSSAQIAELRAETMYNSLSTGGYDIYKDKGRRKNPRTGKSTEAITYNQRNRDNPRLLP